MNKKYLKRLVYFISMVSRFFTNEKEGLKKNIIICSTTVKFSGTHSKEKIINMFVAVYNMNRCQYLEN